MTTVTQRRLTARRYELRIGERLLVAAGLGLARWARRRSVPGPGPEYRAQVARLHADRDRLHRQAWLGHS